MDGWNGVYGILKGLRYAVGVDAGLERDDWMKTAMELYKDDDGLQVLLIRKNIAVGKKGM